MEGIVRVVVFLFLVRTYFVCFTVAGVTGNGMAGLIFSRGTFFNHSKVSSHHASASPHDPYSSSEAIVHLWFSNESKRSLFRWEREMFLWHFWRHCWTRNTLYVSLYDSDSRAISKSIFLGLLRDKRRHTTRT